MPSRDIKDCVPELQEAWPKIREAFKAKFLGWGMVLTCTHRTPEEQFDLYKKGREFVDGVWLTKDARIILTKVDGRTVLSNHNYYPARAFDVALVGPDGALEWEVGKAQWQALPEIVKAAGVVSGGAWTHWKDFPHVEVQKAGWV